MYEFGNGNAPYVQDAKQMIASRSARSALVLSVVALVLSTTGYLSLVPAGIAFMGAWLSCGARQRAQGTARIAMVLSLAAVIASYLVILYTLVNIIVPSFRTPEMTEALNEAAIRQYGVTFDELMADFRNSLGF